MSATLILEHEEVQALREEAESFSTSFVAQCSTSVGPELAFKLIVEADREALPVRAVQALTSLSFPLPTSADDVGLRFVLWKPVVEFLRVSFPIEVEEWLCQGEVALAYLTNDAAAFAQRIIGPLENSRKASPYRSENSGYGVILNSLCELEVQLRYEDPPSAEIIRRIRQLSRRTPKTTDSLRQELARVTESAPDWVIQLCVDFLNQYSSENDQENQCIAIASQESLAKDWLSDQEEQAWRNL